MTLAFIGLSLFAAVLFIQHKIGFRAQKPRDYAAMAPIFDIRKHLNGKMLIKEQFSIFFSPFFTICDIANDL